MPEVTLVDAINLALARALADDPNVVVFGEDVGINGEVFRATAGLQNSIRKTSQQPSRRKTLSGRLR